jgi:hypothetical protein
MAKKDKSKEEVVKSEEKEVLSPELQKALDEEKVVKAELRAYKKMKKTAAKRIEKSRARKLKAENELAELKKEYAAVIANIDKEVETAPAVDEKK